jgi:cell fate regulator YaaT (PSP1 superfamily)
MEKTEQNDLDRADDQEETQEKRDSIVDIADKTVYRIRVAHSNETMLCVCEEELSVHCGDFVIIPTKYGKDLGRIQGRILHVPPDDNQEIYTINRLADKDDLAKYEANEKNSMKAFSICKEKIEQHKLEMKLVSAHYLLEEPKILFFFTAENRVDFRELVKDLVSIFKMRIELRQIGVRDESRVIGGLGICGRYLCCHAVSDKLNPVSIKMAKEQNMSLNSLKISGPCGRLLCCLGYEYDFYKGEKGKLPGLGTKFTINNEQFVITEVNIMTKQIRLLSDSSRLFIFSFKDFFFDKQTNNWLISKEKIDILSHS